MPLSTKQVWDRFSGELRRFIERRVPDRDLAADLLQETFARIHRGLGNLRDDERVLAWVFRLARNTISDHFRASRRRETHSAADVPAEDPELENYNSEVGRCLLAMLASMPETYRAAVELAEVEGLTQLEVGERLGLSLSGAKSRVQRGREMLRTLLVDCCRVELDRRGNVVDYARRGEGPRCCPDAEAR